MALALWIFMLIIPVIILMGLTRVIGWLFLYPIIPITIFAILLTIRLIEKHIIKTSDENYEKYHQMCAELEPEYRALLDKRIKLEGELSRLKRSSR